MGYGNLPVCNRQDPVQLQRQRSPQGRSHRLPHDRAGSAAGRRRGLRVVVICGSIMTMPGLPKTPAAVNIDVTDDGRITGLF